MDKHEILYKYIKRIQRKGLLTLFIKDIFEYETLYDYNYMFRIINEKDDLIIDIYDNVSVNRFNRYIFNFSNRDNNIIPDKENVCVTYLNVSKILDDNNKLHKLAHLASLDNGMIEYANTFLDSKLVMVLKDVIKKIS